MHTLKISPRHLRVGKHSETLLINQVSQVRAENNQKVYKFGFGQSPFPVPILIVDALKEASNRKEYMSVQGHLPLREAIVSFHKQFENKNWSSDQIIIGAGSKILIYSILAAFSRANVLLPAPSWVSYEPQGKLAGHNVHWLSTNLKEKWKLTPEKLEEDCKRLNDPELPIILIFNYPSNPTGQSYSKEELKALSIVMRKYKMIVIADEIYSLLTYQSDYSTLEEFYPEGCIVSSGLSKWCGAGGWRLGFHHIPKSLGQDFFQAVISVASETYSCAPSPIQVAATKAYEDTELASQFLEKQINLLQSVAKFCSSNLREAKVNVHDAQGGFYLFPEFEYFKDKLSSRGIHTSEQLTNCIMEETGVALLPGSAFGMPDSSLTTRLAFVDFDGHQIWKKNNQNSEFKLVKEGIETLCKWLSEL